MSRKALPINRNLMNKFLTFHNRMYSDSADIICILFEHDLNTVLNMISNMVFNIVSNMVLTLFQPWFWTWFQTWFWTWLQNMVLNMVSNMVLNMVLNMDLNMNSSRNNNLISSKQFISFSLYITSYFQGHLRFYSKVFFHLCECFKL